MPRLRVITYNVHGTTGMDGGRRPERNLEVLKRARADLVALQEFVNWPSPSADNLLDHWCTSLGMVYRRFAPAFVRGGHSFGNVLLSRYPLVECQEHDFTAPGCRPRITLHARADIDGIPLHVTVVHLGIRSRARAAQRPLLARLLEHTGDDAHLVMGDFNEWHVWNRTFQLLGGQPLGNGRLNTNGFAGGPALPTFPAIAPALALDRIWARPGAALLGVRVDNLPPAKTASDHLPVIANLQLDG